MTTARGEVFIIKGYYSENNGIEQWDVFGAVRVG